MAGSAKTTLVSKTFTNQTVKRLFDCHAWITLPQNYVIEDLFRSLVKEFHRSRKEEIPENVINSMSYKELLVMLVNYLESKRYLVVLDDVRDINNQNRSGIYNIYLGGSKTCSIQVYWAKLKNTWVNGKCKVSLCTY